MNVKVPYERFEELIRTEVLWELYNNDTAKKKVIYEEIHHSEKTDTEIKNEATKRKDLSASEEESKSERDLDRLKKGEKAIQDITKSITEECTRVGNQWFVDDVLMGFVHNGKFHITSKSLGYMSSEYSFPKTLTEDLKGTEILLKGYNGRITKNVHSTTHKGPEQNNCWIVNGKALQKMGLHEKIFKVEKVDRDQFAYQGR